MKALSTNLNYFYSLPVLILAVREINIYTLNKLSDFEKVVS